MTREDMRRRTRLVVRKDGAYLMGIDALGFVRWTPSAWDAWYTRDVWEAWKVSRKIGAEICLFNPLIALVRKADEGRLAAVYCEGRRDES